MINHIIDLLSGKVPTKEELSLLLKEAIDAEREMVLTRLSDYEKQLGNVQTKLKSMSEEFEELTKELNALQKKYGELKKKVESNVPMPKEITQKSINGNSLKKQPLSPVLSKQVVKRYFSQCTINGFSSSYALMGVDENHSSAYYVVYDDGTNECDFEPLSVKSTNLIMNKRDMLEPICDIEFNGGNYIQVVNKGRVSKNAGNNWIISTKCKIKI